MAPKRSDSWAGSADSRDRSADSRSGAAWGLARAQHGVVTRRQLLALGFSSDGIRHRLRTGRLHRVMQGVYVVGWPGTTRKQRWMAAVLACGDGAVLSHRSAAALWGIAKEGKTIDVSVAREKRRPKVRSRTRSGLPPPQRTIHDRIPVTTPLQTLIDIALELPTNKLERAVNDADKLELIDPEKLREGLHDHAGEPGVKPLRTLLDRDTFLLSDTDL
jgi:predicted transcriptional regulator of viral defense system